MRHSNSGQIEVFTAMVVGFLMLVMVAAIWLGTNGGDPTVATEIANTLIVPVIVAAFIIAALLSLFGKS